jgi:hypothetical protein
MADNYVANAGSGGSTFASDDISSVHYPRVKITWGVDGTATDAGVGAPLPVQVTYDTQQMSAAGTILTPKFVAIAASASGNNTLLASVSSKHIRVLALYLVSNGTVNAKFQSGASGTDLTGLAYLVANTGFVLPFNPLGWFETAVTTLLNLNLSAAIAVGGSMTYVEVS